MFWILIGQEGVKSFFLICYYSNDSLTGIRTKDSPHGLIVKRLWKESLVSEPGTAEALTLRTIHFTHFGFRN